MLMMARSCEEAEEMIRMVVEVAGKCMWTEYRQTSINMINWCSKTVVLSEFVLIGVPNTC